MRTVLPIVLFSVATAACFTLLYHATTDPALTLMLLARDPVSVVELQLLQIQQNPDAGLYALAALQLPPWTGLLHHVNCLFWFTAACASAFAHQLRPRLLTYTLGAISFLLFLDESLLLHERLLPAAQGLALPVLLLAVAALLAAALLQWRAIKSTDLRLLSASALGFLIMLSADAAPLAPLPAMYLEEAAKFSAILLWAWYVCQTASMGFVDGLHLNGGDP